MASEIKVNTIKDLGGNTVLTSNGSGTITGLPASAISSGTVATARLGSGTASSSTFLAGDSSYKTVSGTTINNNADNRVITGSGTANTLEGEANLTFDGNEMTVQGTPVVVGTNSSSVLDLKNTNSSADGRAVGIAFSTNTGGSANAHITAVQDANAKGTLNFGGYDGTSTRNIVMSVNAGTGAVTKPLQPAFFARKTDSGQSVGASSEVTITFNSEIFDNNADFASNTFTAPVSGRYFFSGQVRVNDVGTGDGIRQISIKTSNNSFKNKLVDMADIVNATMPIFTHSVNVFCDMDANDTAVIAVYADTARVVDNEADVTWFCGHLVC